MSSSPGSGSKPSSPHTPASFSLRVLDLCIDLRLRKEPEVAYRHARVILRVMSLF